MKPVYIPIVALVIAGGYTIHTGATIIVENAQRVPDTAVGLVLLGMVLLGAAAGLSCSKAAR